MAIISNKTTEVGDVLLIKAEAPIIGLVTLTDFIDSTDGEDSDTYYSKEFRYSIDGGLNYSDWSNLTTENVASVSVTTTDDFLIEYRYTHSGNDDTLAFNFTKLIGKVVEEQIGQTYKNSIFYDYVKDKSDEIFNWSINVTEKLYKDGIMPKFVERNRGTEANINQDRDYIDFWRVITTFFAIIVVFARVLEDFKNQESILQNYLLQRGIYLCGSENIYELQDLLTSFYSQYFDRGSNRVENGELKRLVCYKDCDELLLSMPKRNTTGWWINRSSPMFKGVGEEINKSYEKSVYIKDPTKYPRIGTISTYSELNGDVFRITSVPTGEKYGIGNKDDDLDLDFSISDSGSISFSSSFSFSSSLSFSTPTVHSHLVCIDPFIGYELSFIVKQLLPGKYITFGIQCFDSDGNYITCYKLGESQQRSNMFFSTQGFNVRDYFKLKGKLLPYYKKGSDENIPGRCLVLHKEAKFIIPYLVVDNKFGIANDMYVYGLNIKPLQKNYSNGGLVQSLPIVDFWLTNRNNHFSESELKSILLKKFIPVNNKMNVNFIDTNSENALIGDFNDDYNEDFN